MGTMVYFLLWVMQNLFINRRPRQKTKGPESTAPRLNIQDKKEALTAAVNDQCNLNPTPGNSWPICRRYAQASRNFSTVTTLLFKLI